MPRRSAISSVAVMGRRHRDTAAQFSKIAKESRVSRCHTGGMTKLRSTFIAAAVAAALAFSVSAQRKSSHLPVPGTETIFSTYHVKRGMEAQFTELNAKTWALYRKLDPSLSPDGKRVALMVDEDGSQKSGSTTSSGTP